MADIPGVCGPNPLSECKIAWSEVYPNNIGIYPCDFLPSKRTIWHAIFTSTFAQAPSPEPLLGGTGFIGVVTFPFLPTATQVRNFQSHHNVIFAKTKNRINRKHVLTNEEITSGEIDVGEYIYEGIAITDDPAAIEQQLTEEEIADLGDECEEDRIFRKLFDQNIPGNRYVGIKPNRRGLMYRLDNDTNKSVSILDSAGAGDLNQNTYRDGSSKIMLADFTTIPLDDPENPEEGPVVYLTYVAIDEHYIRQRINASWVFFDGGLTPNISLPQSLNVVHYRFYEWELEDGTEVAGWRAVESFFAKPNIMTLAGNFNPELAELVPGNGDTGKTVQFLPASITSSDLDIFAEDHNIVNGGPASDYSYEFNYDGDRDGIKYHRHTTSVINQNSDEYRQAEWYDRVSNLGRNGYSQAATHVYFNVHPRSLQKRDVDKFGIDNLIATEIEQDIKAGKETHVPFMDDPTHDNPLLESNQYAESMSSSNTKFEPVQPVQRYSLANLTAIADGLGSFVGSVPTDLFSYHSFNSNIITERFDKETRLLVERFFAIGTFALANIISIEGAATRREAVSCLGDPSKQFIMLAHSTNELLSYKSFLTGYIENDLSDMKYRPDLGFPNYENEKITDFTQKLGYSGMLGERPAITPGNIVAYSDLPEGSYMKWDKTNSPIAFNIENDRLVILPIGNLHAQTSIRYANTGNDIKANLLVKDGSSTNSIVDSIVFKGRTGDSVLHIPHRWIEGDRLDVVTDEIGRLDIKDVSVLSLLSERPDNFLNENSPGFFFEADVMSVAEDQRSFLFVFFHDTENNISAIASPDYGKTWTYFYAIIPNISDEGVLDPFVVSSFITNKCHLFFRYKNKIFVKRLDFNSFTLDGNSDSPGPLQTDESISTPEKAYMAQGDPNDAAFELPEELSISALSYYTNHDVEDYCYSVVRSDEGDMALFYLGETERGLELQCQYSTDDGVSWHDRWEYVENRSRRVQHGSDGGRLFINRSLDGSVAPEENEATDPKVSAEPYEFGVNIHWSRLKKDKEGEGNDIDADSQVLDVSCPYVYYSATNDKLYLFYLYSGCLLCKIFDYSILGTPDNPRKDEITGDDEKSKFVGIKAVKDLIERRVKAHFIDGDIVGLDPAEIQGYYNAQTNETMLEGNVVFPFYETISVFEGRRVEEQRVCATELPNGNVKVYYKINQRLSSAIWNGNQWMIEELLKDPQETPGSYQPNTDVGNGVKGGFGPDAFPV